MNTLENILEVEVGEIIPCGSFSVRNLWKGVVRDQNRSFSG